MILFHHFQLNFAEIYYQNLPKINKRDSKNNEPSIEAITIVYILLIRH